MADRSGFHILWFVAGLIACFVTGELTPMIATVLSSLVIEAVVSMLSRG